MKKHQKTIVVTGATSGIGLAAVRGLVGEGHIVIGTARSIQKADLALNEVLGSYAAANLTYVIGDLSSLNSVRQLSEAIQLKLREFGKQRLDVLVNNAASVTSWFTLNEDGYEQQFAVNHLAPFYLTHLLLPMLDRSDSGRILTVSSGSHRGTRMHWKDVMLRRNYNILRAYKQTKLANVLFTNQFNRLLPQLSRLRAYAVDPGLVNTKIGGKNANSLVNWFWNIRRKKGTTPIIAAETIVYLAIRQHLPEPEAAYWKACNPAQCSHYSRREDAAERLWELSERLCGIEDYFQSEY
jgi:NAD(P)-dependent dehydrogenase (short-subunit alcohol dehydrogenase family)